jgi:outer membrane protein, multidrug efflux system
VDFESGVEIKNQNSVGQPGRALARLPLRLAEICYREGVDDLLIVLGAQLTLFQAGDHLAQIRLPRLLASIGRFKAIGGGWKSTSSSPTQALR